MGKLPLLIIAPLDDLHAYAVFNILKARGIETEWLDLGLLNTNLRLSLSLDLIADGTIVTCNNRKIQLLDSDTIWWRRPKKPTDDIELEQEIRSYVGEEWTHFLQSLEPFSKVVRWVNPANADRLANIKALQLTAAKNKGLRVPRTLITNDSSSAKAFFEEGVPLIYKHIGSAPKPLTATKQFLQSDIDRLNSLKNCPAMFQERIDAQVDIRATIIGDKIFSAEIDSQIGESPIDWRFDHTVPFRQHTMDDVTSAKLLELMKYLGLLYGAVDLRLTPDGEYVFLEINPSGQYLFIELITGLPLSEYMAKFLVGTHW